MIYLISSENGKKIFCSRIKNILIYLIIKKYKTMIIDMLI